MSLIVHAYQEASKASPFCCTRLQKFSMHGLNNVSVVECSALIPDIPYFGGQNIHGSAILRHFVDNIFVVAAWIVGKGRQGRFIRG